MKNFSRPAALIILMTLFAMLIPITPADAGWYGGIDGVYAGVNYANGAASLAPSTLYGANAYAGYNLASNVGVEVGYLGLWGAQSSVKAKIQGATADAVLRVPLIDNLDLDLTGGITYLNGSLQSGPYTAGAYNWGLRGGAGVELALTNSLHWRTLVRYQQDSFHATTTGAIVVSSGLTLDLDL